MFRFAKKLYFPKPTHVSISKPVSKLFINPLPKKEEFKDFLTNRDVIMKTSLTIVGCNMSIILTDHPVCALPILGCSAIVFDEKIAIYALVCSIIGYIMCISVYILFQIMKISFPG